MAVRAPARRTTEPGLQADSSAACALAGRIVIEVRPSAPAPAIVDAVAAVRAGDVAALGGLVAGHPERAGARLGGEFGARTLLHVLTDWPGHRPYAAETVSLLVAAGADVDAPFHR